ncbi:hypothetical protein CEUSTIGMA_g3252.t1 [Chlamydomonas eustigma]|uniref:Translocon-associated protein subunit alpha n=1 Tax=Chlamydomonas eustigma TaxID=1157962 RepID=A0A250WYN8_9CHLO|nr:hypothetical protein CEUSTIGMA_g3252.t1 [Chlamydomonas eustigma]|eukprot:GAX75809.1 hypothetical protein CEUSTIGMA_g3252.t1 [Chlamydomonas eustigma]
MLLILISAAILAIVNGQQTGSAPHPLSILPPPGDIITGYFFPDHSVKHFAAGKPVSVVLGIHNDASELYNITAIMGSLNTPTDFSIFIQNFTQQIYHQVVLSGQEISIDYTFMPDPRLEPRDFVVALTVFYQDKTGQFYSNTFFNQTVEIIDDKKLVDWDLISMFVILAGLAAGAVYLIYMSVVPHLASMGIMNKKTKKMKKVETSKADDAEEWIKGSNYEAHKKKRAAASSGKKGTAGKS